MPEFTINLWAVLVSAVASMILGALWYSPVLFGNLWMKLSKISHEEIEKMKKKGMWQSYLGNFISVLVMAYVLAHFIDLGKATTAAAGAQTAFWTWLGFIATTSLGHVLWEGKPFNLYFLNNAFNLLSMVVMGIILSVWV